MQKPNKKTIAITLCCLAVIIVIIAVFVLNKEKKQTAELIEDINNVENISVDDITVKQYALRFSYDPDIEETIWAYYDDFNNDLARWLLENGYTKAEVIHIWEEFEWVPIDNPISFRWWLYIPAEDIVVRCEVKIDDYDKQDSNATFTIEKDKKQLESMSILISRPFDDGDDDNSLGGVDTDSTPVIITNFDYLNQYIPKHILTDEVKEEINNVALKQLVSVKEHRRVFVIHTPMGVKIDEYDNKVKAEYIFYIRPEDVRYIKGQYGYYDFGIKITIREMRDGTISCGSERAFNVKVKDFD